jgi:hypothetical protein
MYGAPYMAALIFTDNADFDTKNLRLSVLYRCNLRLRILTLLTVGQQAADYCRLGWHLFIVFIE